MKFEIICEALAENRVLTVGNLCKAAGVSRSGYYYYLRHKDLRVEKDKSALAIIKSIFEKSREKDGILSIDMKIRNLELRPINHKKIARIKDEYGLRTRIRQKNPYKGMPKSSEENKQIPNLLQRNFVAPLPDSVYVTDMTYLYYGNCQKAFLSATKDLCTNEIVSYRLMRSPVVNQFVIEFASLLARLPEEKRKSLVVHSDQGFQYTHSGFVELLSSNGVTQSMSRRGNCLDNAAIETFFGHFKDLVELKTCETYEEVQKEVITMIDYYNNERPQRALNKKPPAKYRGLISSCI